MKRMEQQKANVPLKLFVMDRISLMDNTTYEKFADCFAPTTCARSLHDQSYALQMSV